VQPVADIGQLVRESQVVVTTTPTREPWFKAEWLHPGLHVTAVGADGEHKQELEARVFARADRIVCDNRTQCARLGELHHALDAGVLRPESTVTELGALTAGAASGRSSETEITVCDLTGVGVQDTTIAVQTYAAAVELGLGTCFEV
jgi:ornithine cyclodeaminase